MASIPYPLIQGVRHEWSSVEVKASDTVFLGVKGVSWNDSLKPTKIWGTHPMPIGRTRGQYDANGSLEMYLAEANALVAKLGAGYKEKVFDVVVNFAEDGLDPIKHELIGCRIVTEDDSFTNGSDALSVKFDLDIMKILRNGLESVTKPLAGVPT